MMWMLLSYERYAQDGRAVCASLTLSGEDTEMDKDGDLTAPPKITCSWGGCLGM
jgi:hypothetical protein